MTTDPPLIAILDDEPDIRRLLADDDDLIRETLREMLTGMGHQVIEAGSLAEAR